MAMHFTINDNLSSRWQLWKNYHCFHMSLCFLFYMCTEWYMIHNIYIYMIHIYDVYIVFLVIDVSQIQWNTIRITSALCIITLSFIYHSACSFYRLYAVGGRDGSSCLKSVECFDPHTNKWTLCAQMSKRRGGVGVTTWNGLLYAIGGHDAPASNLTSRLSDCVER